jgi:hypothetical protein
MPVVLRPPQEGRSILQALRELKVMGNRMAVPVLYSMCERELV